MAKDNKSTSGKRTFNFKKVNELKMQNKKTKAPKCYNSLSCVLSVLIIVFVIGSIMWDNFITKPQIRQEINEIKIEIKNINTKLLNKVDVPDDQKTICEFSLKEDAASEKTCE